MQVKCVLLPSQRVVNVSCDSLNCEYVREKVAAELSIPSSALDLFERDFSSNKFVRLGSVVSYSSIYALLRCSAGGKGGFRKQLEKKGREFARAKLKEKQASKKAVKSTPPKKKVLSKKSSEVSATSESKRKSDGSSVRSMAAQGVELIVARVLGQAASSS